jgi:hypothetical protein
VEILALLLRCAGMLAILILSYITGACLFGDRDSRNSFGRTVVCFVAGFCFASFLFLLSKIAGSALIFFMGLPLLMLALYVNRKPELVMGIRMGTGDYPAEFFGADSPYFLHHVYSLMSTASYPPPSFEVYGLSLKYHYGAQAFVALASLLTGLKPHFVMFTVVQPMLMVLTGLLAYDICRQLTGRHGAALLCLLLVLLGSKQYFIDYLDPSAWGFLTQAETYSFRYPNLPNVAGLLITLGIVRCLIEFQNRNMRLAALFLLSMLPVFKLPFVVVSGAGLVLVYLYEMRNKFRIELLLEIAGAAVLSLVCLMLFSYSPIVTSAKVELNFPGFLDMMAPWQVHTMSIFLLLVLAVGVVTRYRPSDGTTRLLILVLSPHLLFLILSYENANQHQNQIFDVATSLATLFTAAYLVCAWFSGVPRRALSYAVAIGVSIFLMGPGTVSLLNHIWIVSNHPESGHEYVDNRSIADALKHIPVANALIATNDVRYPANEYSRDYRQFQLAGIFGHRNLASNFAYGFNRDEGILYVELLKLFQSEDWPARQIALLKQKVPITHLLIHKQYRHARDIPLELVFENSRYAVYRF